ncbi:MAG: hypothetical protein RR073_05405 [Clostridia bacterium]
MFKSHLKKIILIIVLIFVILSGVFSFISYQMFSVLSPFSSFLGIAQIYYTDTTQVEIQQKPRIYLAKTTTSLDEYMATKGFTLNPLNEDTTFSSYQNGDITEKVIVTNTEKYSVWKWIK